MRRVARACFSAVLAIIICVVINGGGLDNTTLVMLVLLSFGFNLW